MRLGRFLLLVFALISASPGYSQGPTFDWLFSAGATTTFSGGYGIAHDGLGNIYAAGRFTGTIDFDPGPGIANLTSAGAQDIFVIKVNADGNLVWARRMGGTLDDYSFDLFADESGSVYVTGAFVGTADFDPGAGTFNLSSAGSFEDIFVLKLDTDGNLVWARKMGSSDFDFGRSIAVSATGNVFTTGSFRGTVDFDPGAGTSFLTSTAGGNDIFISKLDASGNFVWAKRMGGTGNDIGYGITLDAAENVFTTGSFSATADFDPGTSVFNLTGVNNGDIFVSKLDGAGNFVWAKGMGGTSSDIGHGIQVDDVGNVYTSGEFSTTVDFDPGPGTVSLVSVGVNDVFISKLDVNGNYLWAKGMGGTIDDESSSLSLDVYGNIYATGSFQSTVDFDPGPGIFNLTTGGSDGFVVKLDTSGDFVWAQAFEGSGGTMPQGVDVDIDGSIYTTGYFSGTVDFDMGLGVFNATAAGSNDTFAHKMLQAATPPTISSFTPASGPIGTTVTITGTNFSPIPANNVVAFNGIAAMVSTSTSTSISVIVPSGATTGAITVTVAGNTATSATDFIVTSPGSLTITSFTPSFGPVGTTVVVTGINFDPTPSNNTVSFNGTVATVTSASASSLTVAVPIGATTGSISVSVGGNTATSSTIFTVTTSTANQAPVIATSSTSTTIGAMVSLDLTPLISDPDNNLDLSTLTIISPPISGANAQLDNGVLLIDYSGIAFVGNDQLTVQVCDILGSCTQQQITISVVDSNTGELIVYTGISPNGDLKNDTWVIENIATRPDTRDNKVSIYNRWGDRVFEVSNYDNIAKVFTGINKNGNELPSGVYFYKIEFSSGRKPHSGYLTVKK